MKRPLKFAVLCLYLTFCGLLIWGYWAFAYRDALTQLTRTGSVQLEQATDRLLVQLDRFRQLPSILATHPLVRDALEPFADPAKVNKFLLKTADVTGAFDIYVLNAKGTTVASSNFDMPRNFIGRNYAFRPYYKDAINGGLGFFHALGTSSGERGFFFAGPIRDRESKPVGVVVVKVDLEALEVVWRADPHIVMFYDENGVVFLSNRNELIFQMYGYETADLKAMNTLRQYPAEGLSALPDHDVVQVFGHTLWRTPNHRSFPATALALTDAVPQIDMTAQVFLNVEDAQAQAQLQTILAAALLGLVSIALYALWQRRQRLADRLAIEEQANLELEARVERRTHQLHQAQDDLVQASKLSALGEMSAGISHELNQPLAAIQNFAENGKILLDRDRKPEVADNLGQITELTNRMDRIIRNLRAFARKEPEPMTRVDVVGVIEDAIKLSDIRAKNENVTIRFSPDAPEAWVMGGGVRLQQVVLNLISNAMDAMRGQDSRSIEITISHDSDLTFVSVRDTGPGLNKPDKIFEPFYTTKSVDSGHGLGLGLSISYGIVQSFGGDIKGASHPDGGAVFTVGLKTAEAEI
ncbi:MAG: sensor histidine kinase [Rhodobacteraceae bacterium]|nr:sensor histidine kinase [Paracoccaceae bacterium]